jgi:hypothetical protein
MVTVASPRASLAESVENERRGSSQVALLLPTAAVRVTLVRLPSEATCGWRAVARRGNNQHYNVTASNQQCNYWLSLAPGCPKSMMATLDRRSWRRRRIFSLTASGKSSCSSIA